MPKRRNLSIEERAAVVTLSEEGYSCRSIARRQKISLCAVQGILRKKSETGTVKDKSRSGRPRATTAREDRLLYRTSLSNRRATSRLLKRALQDSTGCHVSSSTVRRRLNSFGLKGCVAAKKPLLTEKHKKKRLEWCKERQDWTVEKWRKVLWSDESVFELIPARREWIRRRSNERYHPHCVTSTVKYGGAKIQVWGCMAASGVESLKVVEGTLNAARYVGLICDSVKEDGEKLCGAEYVFQQDGAPCHTARTTMAWFERHSVPVIHPWPPQSADLNPIEHLWDEMKRRLEKEPCRNKQELTAAVFQVWNTTTRAVTTNLVDSMPCRCAAVIAAHGGHTKY